MTICTLLFILGVLVGLIFGVVGVMAFAVSVSKRNRRERNDR